jgi:glutaminyl-tRNA synthetase
MRRRRRFHSTTTCSVEEDPNDVEEGQDFTANLNLNSLQVLNGCIIEPRVREAAHGTKYQFERLGYYCVDGDSADNLAFNRNLGLRDTWAKLEKRAQGGT